jgi:EAL domain-containing protein (putative c-di-GMP-specific phosphodiesterase class I)/GGDEF domain-containing protein
LGQLSLTKRAVLFVASLLVITGFLAVGAVVVGFHRQVQEIQDSGAQRFAAYIAEDAGRFIAQADTAALGRMMERAGGHMPVRGIGIFDGSGALISAKGVIRPEALLLVTEMLEGRQARVLHFADGALAVVCPFSYPGVHGAALLEVHPRGFRVDTLPALGPFFGFLAALLIVVLPISVFLIRRTIAPLGELARFAESLAAGGEAKPIIMRTGDEFQTLARAFNHMIERHTASLRRIQQIAFVDPVTQLPNQDRFQREVDFFIMRADPAKDLGAAFIFDFEGLGRVMHTLAPGLRRDLLRLAAERFAMSVEHAQANVRGGTLSATMARSGASEFAVFVGGFAMREDVTRFGQSLMDSLSQAFDWNGHKLSLSPFCGVALAPRDGADADAVVRHARMALTEARNSIARAKMFSRSLDRKAMSRLNIEREIRAALDTGEFRAFFQPKVNPLTGRIEAAEALARWIRPDGSIVNPGRFIPVAEESGLIEPLSDAIMREACWKAAAWSRAGHRVHVAVNVSALQFRNDRFPEHVLQIVNHAGLAPELLELELTETIALENPERAKRLIEPLREAGVRFAIDDFGCGHSSLSALSKLPFDVIKIDQQFLRDLKPEDPQSGAIIEMILALAKALHLDVVAEGVERQEQADFVSSRGCRWVQGFLFGAAVSPLAFGELLDAQVKAEARARALAHIEARVRGHGAA